MYLDEFHCVVVGNEPAGLWLLKRLAGATDETGKPLHCAWVRLPTPSEPVAIPTVATAEFGIELKDAWHAELVTKRRNLEWRPEAIQAAFPGLSETLWEKPVAGTGFSVRPGRLGAHRKAIERHPDLLSFATGMWKALGRTPHLQPDVLLWSTLLATELATWTPTDGLPGNLSIIEACERDNPLEEAKSGERGALSLKFRNMKPIVARHWVLNLPFQAFARLSSQSDALSKWLTTNAEAAANRTLYRFRFKAAEAAVSLAAPPLVVAFDAEVIPDWDTELWPFRVERAGGIATVELTASAPTGVPLDAVLERFRGGMKSLGRLFPFLPTSVQSFSVPLSLDSCYDEAARFSVSRQLEQESIELYANTSLHTVTRHKSLTALFPSVHCGLPYPLGPLTAAKRVVADILGKPKKKEAKLEAETAPPAAP